MKNAETVADWLNRHATKFFVEGIKNVVERLIRCIDHNGENVKK